MIQYTTKSNPNRDRFTEDENSILRVMYVRLGIAINTYAPKARIGDLLYKMVNLLRDSRTK